MVWRGMHTGQKNNRINLYYTALYRTIVLSYPMMQYCKQCAVFSDRRGHYIVPDVAISYLTFTLEVKSIWHQKLDFISWLNWNDCVMEACVGKHLAQFHRFSRISQHLMLAAERPCGYTNVILIRSVRFRIVGHWLVLLKNCSNHILTLRKHALQSSIEFVADNTDFHWFSKRANKLQLTNYKITN